MSIGKLSKATNFRVNEYYCFATSKLKNPFKIDLKKNIK